MRQEGVDVSTRARGWGWWGVLAGGRGTRGGRRGTWGRIGRDSQAAALRSSPGTPLEDLKQWRYLVCVLKGHSGCYVESIECRQSTWI